MAPPGRFVIDQGKVGVGVRLPVVAFTEEGEPLLLGEEKLVHPREYPGIGDGRWELMPRNLTNPVPSQDGWYALVDWRSQDSNSGLMRLPVILWHGSEGEDCYGSATVLAPDFSGLSGWTLQNIDDVAGGYGVLISFFHPAWFSEEDFGVDEYLERDRRYYPRGKQALPDRPPGLRPVS